MEPQIQIALVINSDSLHPDKITELIGVIPTEMYVKGELIAGTIRPRDVSSWCYSLTDIVDHYDLGEALAKLIEILAPKAEQISSACKSHGLEAIFSCGIDVVDESPSIYISPEIIFEISRFGASLDIDIILSE